MTKSNRKSLAIQGEDNSVLALVRRERAMLPSETTEQYDNQCVIEAFERLSKIKNRSEQEQKEYEKIRGRYIAIYMVQGGYIPNVVSDEHLRMASSQIYQELQKEFGRSSMSKNLLMDRLVCAVNMAYSYEILLQSQKYTVKDEKMSSNHDDLSIKRMKEWRRGIESANEQILRLTQALHQLSAPPVQVKVTNAFFAENQQVNQAMCPKDLDKFSAPEKQ